MKLNEKDIIFTRPYKTLYANKEKVIKVFDKKRYSKADVFNEALNEANVEETGLYIPEILEVSETPDGWALVREKVEGVTLDSLMKENPDKLEEYMEQFVDLQLEIHSKKCPGLKKLKAKLQNQINSLKDLDATTRYELSTRLDGMPRHTKLCHGDFNPTNIIVDKKGNWAVIDWAHAAQEAGRYVHQPVLQEERHCPPVCKPLAAYRSCCPAYQEKGKRKRFPDEMD